MPIRTLPLEASTRAHAAGRGASISIATSQLTVSMRTEVRRAATITRPSTMIGAPWGCRPSRSTRVSRRSRRASQRNAPVVASRHAMRPVPIPVRFEPSCMGASATTSFGVAASMRIEKPFESAPIFAPDQSGRPLRRSKARITPLSSTKTRSPTHVGAVRDCNRSGCAPDKRPTPACPMVLAVTSSGAFQVSLQVEAAVEESNSPGPSGPMVTSEGGVGVASAAARAPAISVAFNDPV